MNRSSRISHSLSLTITNRSSSRTAAHDAARRPRTGAAHGRALRRRPARRGARPGSPSTRSSPSHSRPWRQTEDAHGAWRAAHGGEWRTRSTADGGRRARRRRTDDGRKTRSTADGGRLDEDQYVPGGTVATVSGILMGQPGHPVKSHHIFSLWDKWMVGQRDK